MLNDALVIAVDSYKSANRRKGIVYFLLIVAILQVGVFSLYGEISQGNQIKMLKDVGLGMITLVGLLSALTTAFQIPGELRDRTAMTIFSKPLGREAYLVGKLIGISGLVLRNMAVVTIGILIILMLNDKAILNKAFTSSFLQSFWLSFLGSIDLIAVTLILCLFLSEGTVVISAVIIFILGNATYMFANSDTGLAGIAGIVRYIIPDFHMFDIKSETASIALDVSSSFVMYSTAYGLAYATMAVSLALIIFKQRDL
jgi:hypothetical protein